MSKIYKYLPPTRFYSSVSDGDGGHLDSFTLEVKISKDEGTLHYDKIN